MNEQASDQNQNGFTVIEAVLLLIIVGIMGFVGWRVLSAKDEVTQETGNLAQSEGDQTSQDTSNVAWSFNGTSWESSGTPPVCPDPLELTLPVHIKSVWSVLYPGQYRNGDYKPHGGFRFDSRTNKQSISAPMDAKLVSGSRYIEQGETQYMLFFVNDCGIAYRFDHLLTLSDEMQAVADTLPKAKLNDSRTTNFSNPITVKTGDVIATSVGFAKTKNVSVDFGVYDLREVSETAQDGDYARDHKGQEEQAFYAICMLDVFDEATSASLHALPAADSESGKQSDYCQD